MEKNQQKNLNNKNQQLIKKSSTIIISNSIKQIINKQQQNNRQIKIQSNQQISTDLPTHNYIINNYISTNNYLTDNYLPTDNYLLTDNYQQELSQIQPYNLEEQAKINYGNFFFNKLNHNGLLKIYTNKKSSSITKKQQKEQNYQNQTQNNKKQSNQTDSNENKIQNLPFFGIFASRQSYSRKNDFVKKNKNNEYEYKLKSKSQYKMPKLNLQKSQYIQINQTQPNFQKKANQPLPKFFQISQMEDNIINQISEKQISMKNNRLVRRNNKIKDKENQIHKQITQQHENLILSLKRESMNEQNSNKILLLKRISITSSNSASSKLSSKHPSRILKGQGAFMLISNKEEKSEQNRKIKEMRKKISLQINKNHRKSNLKIN